VITNNTAIVACKVQSVFSREARANILRAGSAWIAHRWFGSLISCCRRAAIASSTAWSSVIVTPSFRSPITDQNRFFGAHSLCSSSVVKMCGIQNWLSPGPNGN
jgi:hypothetical protein